MVEWLSEGKVQLGIGACDDGVGHYPHNDGFAEGRKWTPGDRDELLRILGIKWPA
jgi:hypothetical protein